MIKLGSKICVKNLLFNFVKSPVVDTIKTENLVLLNGQFVRNISFLNKFSKEQLWKGVLSVSNAGRRKGRGKRRDNMHNKYATPIRMQGEGTLRISWPGLNTQILKEGKLVKIKPASDDVAPKVLEQRERPNKYRSLHPLERGWSGRLLGGKKLGPPKPILNYTFENFESVILKHSSCSIMTSIFGKKRKFSTIVATGNGDGLLGLAEVSKSDARISINVAQSKAAQKLLTIDLIDKHTVNHDFFSQFGSTKVFVFKMPEGYGLRCHRVITEICRLIGIKNLHAKVEGPCNVTNIIKAFVGGLLRQKTYQQIADENNLHLVEFKEESYNFPLVMASPKKCLTLSEARKHPVVFDEYIMGNKLVYKPEKKVPFYQKLPSWRTHLLKTLFFRNHDKVKIDLMVKYDACNSHLTAIYPECQDTSGKYKLEEKTSE